MTGPSHTLAATERGGAPRGAWRIIALLCAINTIGFLDKSALGLVAVPLREEFDLTPTEFGMIGSVFFLVFALAASGLAWLGNRFSPRWLLLGLVVLWSVLQWPIALTSSIAMLIVARVALAVVEGPSGPLMQVTLHQWFPEKRRQAPTMVFHSSGPLAAVILVPLLTAATALWGWRTLFHVLAIAGLVVALLWAFFGKQGPVTDANAHGKEAGPALVPPPVKVPYRTILCSGTFLGAAAALFVSQWSIALASAWIPSYFEEGLGFTATVAGLLLGATYIFTAVGMIFYGVVSQRRSVRGHSSHSARVVPLAVMLVLSALTMALSTLIGLPMVSGLLLGLAIGMAQGGFGIGSVVLGEVVPQGQRAAVLGIWVTLASVGSILAPTVFGVLVENGASILNGYHHAWWVTAAIMAVMAFAITRLIRTDKDGPRFALAAAHTTAAATN